MRQVCQKKLAKIHTSAEQAFAMMDKLPQGSLKNDLWWYLDSNWLSDDQINDQLELLQNELSKTHSPPSSDPNTSKSSFPSVLIKNVFLTMKIFTAFTRQEQNTYKTECSFNWVQSAANNIIQERKMLMTIVNLKNINSMQHWTLVAITDGGATILWGFIWRTNTKETEVFTLPPLFWADSGRTPTDSTYPECQIFGSGIAGIVQ